ncbi:hypothetical protein KFU94_03540 [Chloroflexi bacterium TSY]|nr:hypothetical protein [Chloroflexi bacterium TSY]
MSLKPLPESKVQRSFADLAQRTGGAYFVADEGAHAIDALQQTLQNEFSELAFDEQVLALCDKPSWTVDGLCAQLDRPINVVSHSLGRLGRRGLL